MKKILSILGAISLVGTSTSNIYACDLKNILEEYTPEELAKLKEENKINTTDENIKKKLEWIAPQEKPFNKVDNKYYYVIWRGDKKDNWYLSKFDNNVNLNYTSSRRKIDNLKEYQLNLINKNIGIMLSISTNEEKFLYEWYNKDYFKSVYRWNLDTQEPNLIIDNDGNIKVEGE